MRTFNTVKIFFEIIKKRKTEIITILVIVGIFVLAVKGWKKIITASKEMKKPPYVSSELTNEEVSDPQTPQPESFETDESPTTTFRISPDGCMKLFHKTPAEFIPEAKTFFSWSNGFCKKAELVDGDLLLTMTEKQQNQWRDVWKPDIEAAKKTGRIEVSEDFTKITLIGYKETVAQDGLLLSGPILGGRVFQFLNTQDADSIKMDFTVIDGGTGEVKYHCLWPEEEYRFKVRPAEYSSINR